MLMCKALQIWISTSGLPGIVMDTELNDEIHALLPLITEETVVVAFSFPDYYFMTTKIVEFSKKSGAKVIGITNVEESPIAEFQRCASVGAVFYTTVYEQPVFTDGSPQSTGFSS